MPTLPLTVVTDLTRREADALAFLADLTEPYVATAGGPITGRTMASLHQHGLVEASPAGRKHRRPLVAYAITDLGTRSLAERLPQERTT